MADTGISKPYSDPPGVVKAKQLKDAGFSDAEVSAWASKQSQTLASGGFKPSEIDAYWGSQTPESAAITRHVENNLALNASEHAKVATNPAEAFHAGWDVSVTGLAINRKLPELVQNPNAGVFSRVMSGVGQFLGDAPASVGGFFGGAAAGAAVPVAGETGVSEIIGGGFGMGATPEAGRQVLLDAYKAHDGRIKTWQDAVHVIASSLWDTAKAGAIGAVTNVVGGKAGELALKAGASELVSGGANATAQVAAATGTGAALDGKVPDARDFTAAALLTLGLHGAGAMKAAMGSEAANRVQHNMETLYRQTGIPPWEAAERASRDPVFKQELHAQDPNGDPVTPQFRNVAPDEPPPYTPKVQASGLMEEHQAGWIQPETMRDVSPPKSEPSVPSTKAPPGPVGQPSVGELYTLSHEDLIALHAEKGSNDHDKLVQAFGSEEAAAEFKRLDRAQNSMDPQRADAATKEFHAKYGNLTPEQDRLVYGIGETDAQQSDIKPLLDAHSDVMPGDSQSWLSYVAALGVRGASVEDLANVTKGKGSPEAQAAYIRIAKAYEGMKAAGVDTNEIPRRMAQALVDKGGWKPEQAREVIGGFVNDIAAQQSRPKKGPFTPSANTEPEPQKALPAATGLQVYANDVPHAKSLLASLEGSGDRSVSPAGAIGKYQIMPATARQYMGNDFDVKTLFDPKVNSMVADRIVADLYKRYNGDMNAIAIAYNAGPGRAGQYVKAGPGTVLEAIPDKTLKSGIRYESRPSNKDESFLPLETQHYLANKRRRLGESTGAGGEGPPSEQPNLPIPSYSDEGAGGGAGGGGPPKPPAVLEGEDPEEVRKSFWAKQTDDTLKEEILRNVGVQPDPTARLFNLDRILGQFVSELTPARRIDDRLIKAGEMDRKRDLGAEDMFRQTYASDTRAGVFVRYGAVDPITLDIKKGSKSVMDAVAAVKEDGGDMDGWTAYMLARRTVDKATQGVKTGFNPAATEAYATRPAQTKKYARATGIFNEVMNSALDYSRDSGVHSQEQIDAMKRDNPAYISMRRIMGDDDAFSGAGRGFQARDSLKKMEGSDRQIVDPIRATLDNIRLIVKMADRNRAIGHVIGQVERGDIDNPGLVKIEDSQTIKNPDEKLFKAYGLPPEEAAATYGPLLAERQIKSHGPNDFVFIRDGKPEVWRASSPELADLMRKADGPGQANIVMKTFETFAKVERAGIVYSADFPVRNVLRDQITTFVNDPLHPPPFITWLRGIGHVIGQSDTFKDAVAKGALGSSMVDMDLNWFARDMDKVFEDTGTWDGVANTVKHPLEFFQIIAEKLDAGSRVGYFLHAQGQGIQPIKAATMSRKAYLDFAERGTAQVANQLSRIMPFFRPTLLGFKQFGEAMAERPASTLAYAVAAISMPNIALYAMCYLQDQFLPKDRKYANLPRWVKDNYFVTPEIGGTRIKLRYPQEAGTIFGGMVTRMLDTFVEHDKHAFEGWANGFLQNYLPPLMPPLAQVPIEVMTNHSFFTGQQLIPGSMEKASGYMQYTPNTSETGKALSRVLGPSGLNVLGFSPIQFDQFVKGWTGAIGQGALHALDIPFHPSKKPWEVADLPFAGSFFTRNPGMSAQPIQTFYGLMEDLEAKHADFGLAMKHATNGDDSEIDKTAPAGQYASAMAPIKAAIGVQEATIQGIAADKTMTDKEKRQQIDALLPQMIGTAQQGIKAIDDLRQTMKEQADVPENAAPPPAPEVGGPPAGRAGAAPPPLPGANRGQVPIA